MKKQRLEELMNEMVQENIIELDNSKDGAEIEVKHIHSKRMNGFLKANKAKFLIDWPEDIVRNEAYACLYESMVIASKDLDIEDIREDNADFMGVAYATAAFKMKERLIPESKRSANITNVREIPVSPKAKTDKEGNSANSVLEDLLAGNISVDTEEEEERKNHFLKWFDNNKDFILTKKQLQFLDGEVHHKDPDKARTMRKRISERVSRAYNEQYGEVSPIVAILVDQERILEEILDAKSFRAAYDKYKDEDFIIDAIAEYVALDYLRAFNKGNDNPETIRAMRIALYKRLGEVINMIEANR